MVRFWHDRLHWFTAIAYMLSKEIIKRKVGGREEGFRPQQTLLAQIDRHRRTAVHFEWGLDCAYPSMRATARHVVSSDPSHARQRRCGKRRDTDSAW